MSQTVFPSTVQRARTLVRPRTSDLGGLFDLPRVRGRVVEVSEAGSFGALSALCGLLAQVQALGDQIVWVETGSSLFFPPDLAFRGLDVGAITVILAPGTKEGLLAADWVVRSGAFPLVVVDWAGGMVDEADLGRLARVAEDRESTVLFLTRKPPEAPSLATQVSLRGTVTLGPGGETRWQVTRDKRSGPPVPQAAVYHGPFGLY